MDSFARQMLEKLLELAEKSTAGRRQRAPVLTANDLRLYRDGHSFQQKESFETAMRAAIHAGAIRVEWDGEAADNGFIKRVELGEHAALAAFLEIPTNASQVDLATQALKEHFTAYPILREVVDRWKSLRPVRSLGPESTEDWLDAIRVVAYTQKNRGPLSVPIREASARLFNDSKRIEKLAGPLDVLQTGRCDLGGRPSTEVFQALGLYREEQPVRLAGKVVIRRERLSAIIDRPYIALHAQGVLGIDSNPRRLISIENLTTFHSEAKLRCDEEILLVYTGGMPTPAWRAMYGRLLNDLPEGAEVLHWGDVDEGGFRIAALISAEARGAGHALRPWRMAPADVPNESRKPAQPATVARMVQYARATGWDEIAEAIANSRFTSEQESL